MQTATGTGLYPMPDAIQLPDAATDHPLLRGVAQQGSGWNKVFTCCR